MFMPEEFNKIASGILEDGNIISITDPSESQYIYSKGFFGTFNDGILKCDLFEALYLMEVNKLTVMQNGTDVTFKDLYISLSKTVPFSSVRYFVYRDIRSRGMVVKFRNDFMDFNVLPRGGTPKKNPSKYWVKVYSERWQFNMKEIIDLTSTVHSAKKKFIIGVVDEEGDLTYYDVKFVNPVGRINKPSELKEKIEGILFEDRVIVYSPASIDFLQQNGMYGKVMNGYLILSLLETLYLMENGYINVKNGKTGRKVSIERLKKLYKNIESSFFERYTTYSDLREKRLIVKTGFKYGSHFRCYIGDPEQVHAKYLVHAVEHGYETMWAEISRAVRLAHGVKKQFILAVVGAGDKIIYIKLERIRL